MSETSIANRNRLFDVWMRNEPTVLLKPPVPECHRNCGKILNLDAIVASERINRGLNCQMRFTLGRCDLLRRREIWSFIQRVLAPLSLFVQFTSQNEEFERYIWLEESKAIFQQKSNPFKQKKLNCLDNIETCFRNFEGSLKELFKNQELFYV